MLLDKFNRPLDVIEILAGDEPGGDRSASDTGRDLGQAPSFPSEHIVAFMKIMSALGLGKALIAGKEPLLRPDIVDLVSQLSHIRPKVEITLRTASPLLPKLIEPLASAGLDRLWVTLPAIDPATYSSITGHDEVGLEQIIFGMKLAEQLGVHTTIEAVRTPGVDQTAMVEAALWGLSRGFAVRIMEGADFDESGDFFDRTLEQIGKVCHLEPGEDQYIWNVAGGGPRVELITCSRTQNCYECRKLWLSAEGKIKLCSHHHEEHDLGEMFDPGSCHSDLLDFAAKIPLNKPQGFFSRTIRE
ncbi:MAG: radical SAM protein [Nitrospinota bacterium]|nr:radical SAM protein [Nitrospinota bacterium]